MFDWISMKRDRLLHVAILAASRSPFRCCLIPNATTRQDSPPKLLHTPRPDNNSICPQLTCPTNVQSTTEGFRLHWSLIGPAIVCIRRLTDRVTNVLSLFGSRLRSHREHPPRRDRTWGGVCSTLVERAPDGKAMTSTGFTRLPLILEYL